MLGKLRMFVPYDLTGKMGWVGLLALMKSSGVSTHFTRIARWVGVVAVVVVLGIFQVVHGSEGGAARQVATVVLPGLAKGARPLEMIRLKAGTFQMGCPEEERGRVGREWPPHEVTLTKTIEMGRCEVTQAQWLAVMGQAPVTGHGEGPDHPVYHVTWTESVGFLERLNRLGLGRFRLPTEAEWEYACRAGSSRRFWFGDVLECSDEREFCQALDRHLWWGGNNGKEGHPFGAKPVASKAPNPWGFHDLHGNVWEWCADGWEPPRDRGPQRDPVGAGTGDLKVMRGGAWESHALHLRSADRCPMGADDRTYGRLIGFRVVRE